MAPAGTNVSAALALASNSDIVVATNPIKNIKNTRMMLFSLRSLNTSAKLLLQIIGNIQLPFLASGNLVACSIVVIPSPRV
jgi:hypothetical protein